MSIHKIKIATRQSELALWQANYVKNRLAHFHPHLQFELVPLLSLGDKLLDSPLSKIGGKGLFVKELEQALLNKKADLAVHSMKDVPLELPPELGLHCICEREDQRDVLISNKYANFKDLPPNAIIGTSSLRRSAQLLAANSYLQIKSLRGNVNTRLAKLDNGEYDAIILAAAGLKRLGLEDRVKEYLPQNLCLSAGGQGAIGIECLNNNLALIELLKPLAHQKTTLCVTAERALNQHLNGGCQVPIACFADLNSQNMLTLKALVASEDGSLILRSQKQASSDQAQELGISVAQDLLNQGADAILAKIGLKQ